MRQESWLIILIQDSIDISPSCVLYRTSMTSFQFHIIQLQKKIGTDSGAKPIRMLLNILELVILFRTISLGFINASHQLCTSVLCQEEKVYISTLSLFPLFIYINRKHRQIRKGKWKGILEKYCYIEEMKEREIITSIQGKRERERDEFSCIRTSISINLDMPMLRTDSYINAYLSDDQTFIF